MSHIYITDNGSILGINGGRYVIKNKNEDLRSIPKETVESISVFGSSTISTKAIHQLLIDGIPVNFFSGRGKYYGVLQSTYELGKKSQVMNRQFSIFEDDRFRLELAKKMIQAKIHNQRVLLSRLCKARTSYITQFNQITAAEKKIPDAVSEEQIMGFEGIAARSYFQIMGQIVETDFRFEKRTRRPPKDAFNSMLSLGYTLLSHENVTALQSAGLNPYNGLLHAERNGGAALAFDMIEEWRVPVVDAAVTSMVNGHEIKIDDFMNDYDGNAIYLTNQGMRKFLKKYERKMVTKTKYLDYEDAGAMSFREAMFRQCKSLRQCIEEHDENLYHPFRIR